MTSLTIPLSCAQQVSHTAATTTRRLLSIDALRGLIIIFMLLDHCRDTFFLHQQVMDPMDVTATSPALFWGRLLTHLCAPVFVFLTGLSAYLYSSNKTNPQAQASAFLFKRGLFLIILEITLVNFAWTFQFPPHKIFLQVIWAIGLSMIALSIMLWLPRKALLILGIIIIAGHNMLDSVHFQEESFLHIPWAILHDRGWVIVSDALRFRTSYPALPWFGVIALGYVAGPWFASGFNLAFRQKRLLQAGTIILIAFIVFRLLNFYGDKPWFVADTAIMTIMSFLNITKYPPSLLFILSTLGIGLLILRLFEKYQNTSLLTRALPYLAVFGSAPMFFYLLHLYVLRILYLSGESIFGQNQGSYFGFASTWQLWLCTALLAALLYYPVKAFASYKKNHKNIAWLKYL